MSQTERLLNKLYQRFEKNLIRLRSNDWGYDEFYIKIAKHFEIHVDPRIYTFGGKIPYYYLTIDAHWFMITNELKGVKHPRKFATVDGLIYYIDKIIKNLSYWKLKSHDYEIEYQKACERWS